MPFGERANSLAALALGRVNIMKVFCKTYFLLVGLAFLGACSTTKVPSPEFLSKESLSIASPEEAPFSLQILDEFNDGDRLHVLGAITPKSEWDPAQVMVKLSSLKDGETVNSANYFFDPSQGALEVGKKVSFALVVDTKDASDYQVALLWGNQAGEAKARINLNWANSIELRNMQVNRIGVDCLTGTCPQTFQVLAEIVNVSGRTVPGLVLGVTLDRVNGPTNAASEKFIEVPNLNLSAGRSRPIELELENGFPQGQIADYLPKIRVVKVLE